MINFKLDHIAYAVQSTDESIEIFKAIYPDVTTYKIFEKSQNVYITYLSNKNADHKIELIEGARSPNPVENMVKSREAVPYHTCYRVEDFDKAALYFKKKRFFMVSKPFETVLEKRTWACHFFHPNGGIIEIMGPKRKKK